MGRSMHGRGNNRISKVEKKSTDLKIILINFNLIFFSIKWNQFQNSVQINFNSNHIKCSHVIY